jgi:hypothetical protein
MPNLSFFSLAISLGGHGAEVNAPGYTDSIVPLAFFCIASFNNYSIPVHKLPQEVIPSGKILSGG